jgi:hypothetical protein
MFSGAGNIELQALGPDETTTTPIKVSTFGIEAMPSAVLGTRRWSVMPRARRLDSVRRFVPFYVKVFH